MPELDVYLEVGRKRVFAAAIDWPGWCRSGRDEAGAVAALLHYLPRYAAVLEGRTSDLPVSVELAAVNITERLAGDATTDFGAPGAVPASDHQPVDAPDLERLLGLLAGCWAAFERAAGSAKGVVMASGPRGGGRDLVTIREHVAAAHAAYTRKLGGRDDFVDAVRARWRGEVPDSGPRGGARWPPRYAIRRAAWHILDHAWEIEDRLRR